MGSVITTVSVFQQKLGTSGARMLRKVIVQNTTTLLAILNCIHFTAAIVAEVFIIRTFKCECVPDRYDVKSELLKIQKMVKLPCLGRFSNLCSGSL